MVIRSITKSDLPECLEIFHRGYETVAVEFGLTEENCPDRGRASLPFEKLTAEYNNGTMMFGYVSDNKIVGFLGMKMMCDAICFLNDIVVLPEYRQHGNGKVLLNHCKKKALELNASILRLGMLDDNKRLRKWYEKHGFSNIEYKKYDGAHYTVGVMDCVL